MYDISTKKIFGIILNILKYPKVIGKKDVSIWEDRLRIQHGSIIKIISSLINLEKFDHT